MKATVGEDGQQELRAVVNTSLIENTLAAKFFGSIIQDDGFIKNETMGGKNGETDYQSYGVTFLYTPNEAFEALLTLENFSDDSELSAFNTNYNLAPGIAPAPTGPRDPDFRGGFLTCLVFSFIPGTCRTDIGDRNFASNDTKNAAKLDTNAITAAMSYDLNENLTLVSTTGYRELEEYGIFDFDGSPAPFITIEKFNDFDQFSQEFRIDGSYDKVNFTAGLYYFNSEFERDWRTAGAFWQVLGAGILPIPAGAFLPDTRSGWQLCQDGEVPAASPQIICDPGIAAYPGPTASLLQVLYEKQETTSVAAFAQADWEFSEDWTLTLGLRWTREEKDFLAGQGYITTVERQDAFAYPAFVNLKKRWTETSPKLGLTYQVSDTAILYGSYSEGFHSGGFFGTNQNIADFERDQYDPEYAESVELGYKSMLIEGRLRLNVTAFRNDFTDKQESSIAFDPGNGTVATIFDNVSDATYQGIEIETEFMLTQNLRVFFNYGYLDAEYGKFETDLDLTDADPRPTDATNLKPRDAPDFTLGFGTNYTMEIGAGRVEFYAKYTEVDDSEDLTNSDFGRRDSANDLTASIGYHAETWSLVAFGRNITDEQNETAFALPAGGNLGLFGAGTVGQGRTYALEFTYEM